MGSTETSDQSQTHLAASAPPPNSHGNPPSIMPANVRAGQVIALVEVTGGLGSTIDASKLAEEFSANLQTLLPILDAAEMLGLVKVDRGDVSLTDFGLKFQRTSKQKVRLVSDRLKNIEPFKTALELCQSKRSVTSSEIAEATLAKDIRWHHSPEINEAEIQAILINWAIYAGLLKYDGRDGKFERLR